MVRETDIQIKQHMLLKFFVAQEGAIEIGDLTAEGLWASFDGKLCAIYEDEKMAFMGARGLSCQGSTYNMYLYMMYKIHRDRNRNIKKD